MYNAVMKAWMDSSYLASENQSYIENLYENFLTDPHSVDDSWYLIFKNLFTSMSKINHNQIYPKILKHCRHRTHDVTRRYTMSLQDIQNTDLKQLKVLQLIDAFRIYGYENANIDPLNLYQKNIISHLNIAYYVLSEFDLQAFFKVGSFAINQDNMRLLDLYRVLQKTYCGSIGAEYMHMSNAVEKEWIQKHIKSAMGEPRFSIEEKKRFIFDLTAAEGIERYLGTRFPGAKRFSLEGGEALILMLKEMVRYAGSHGMREVVIGMAHCGRLNVLINVLGKKPKDLFDEFSNTHKKDVGTGDVKYHQGFSSDIETTGGLVHLVLAFNPSHLEIISPVVMGSVRARIDRLDNKSNSIVLPITLHGDAAIIGQGVVQETLNMSKVRGYEVGGTVRVVINNQVGFTTSNPEDARSTKYCTDIIKMVQAPIFHVNADDPEAGAFVSRIALDFRNTFKRDVMIDLVCYRRHGHNEADEPTATQPMMYQKINKHPTIRKIYADRLKNNGIVTLSEINKMINVFRNLLNHGECVVKEWRQMNIHSSAWQRHFDTSRDAEYTSQLNSKQLQVLANRISTVPDSIDVHPRVAKIYYDRVSMANCNKPFDWGGAEILAYATILDQGIPIRLSGEDTARGTFFHRHAVIYNQQNASSYTHSISPCK